MFPQAVPPEISGSFWKGPRPAPAKHLPCCHWLRDSFLLHSCWCARSPAPLETSAICDTLSAFSPNAQGQPCLYQVCELSLFVSTSAPLMHTDSLRGLLVSWSHQPPVLLRPPLAAYLPWLPTAYVIKPNVLNLAGQSSSQSSPTLFYRSISICRTTM